MERRVLGPIFSVELYTSGRRTRYFVVRVLYALILLCALWLNYQSAFSNYTLVDYAAGAPGEHTIAEMASFASTFFTTFTWMQLFAVLMLTPAMVAGTVAQEHERRTIEYLLVSPLRNSEIVLGKLVPRVMAVSMQLLVGLPVLAIAMLLGGIGPDALLTAFLVMLITLLAVASISLAVSTWTRRTRDAITRAYLVLLAWLVAPPILSSIVGVLLIGGPSFSASTVGPVLASMMAALSALLMLNPVYALGATTWAAAADPDAWTILAWFAGGNLLLTVICVGAALVGVRRTAIAGMGGAIRPGGWRWRLPTWRPALGAHPMLWKELFAERAAVTLGWPGRIASLLLLGGLLFYMLFAFISSWDDGRSYYNAYLEFVAFAGTLVSCLGMLFMTARAAGGITSEKERDCWVTLISTPLTGREIVLGKVCGALYASRWWFALLLLMYALGAVRHPPYLLAVPVQLATVLLLSTFGITLGTFCSLFAKTSLRAMGTALAIAVVLGGGYMLCGSIVLIAGLGGGEAGVLVLAPCIAFLVGFAHWGPLAWLNDSTIDVGWVGAAYALGMILYTVATATLLSICIESFDARAGRKMERLAKATRSGTG